VESNPGGVGADVAQAIALASDLRHSADEAREGARALRASLDELFSQVEVLALPTLPVFAPRLEDLSAESLFPTCIELTAHVAPFNAAGVPATAQPVPTPGHRTPASLQLVGPAAGEELLVTTAAVVEAANR
jgi:Asp-tRNA(Asn)/Glu-tRNA(Gln) amidotransferase A subunit family amidase